MATRLGLMKQLMNCSVCSLSIVGAIAILAIAGTGIGRTQTLSQTPDTLVAVDPNAIARWRTANTKFGLKLFAQMVQQEGDRNIVISPLGISMAMAMTYNGARGTTRQEIARTLEWQGISDTVLNRANAEEIALLDRIDPAVELAIANSFWGRQEETFKPQFIQTLQEFYRADIRQVEFSDPQTVRAINEWVREETNGNINALLGRDDLNSDTVAVLINAIHFMATWTLPFPEDATRDRPFSRSDGTQIEHPIMFLETQYLAYCETPLFEAIELPYGNEGRLAMYVFLPKPDRSLVEFYEQLTLANWQRWLDRFEVLEGTIEVGLPRFQIEYKADLKSTLQQLGIITAFNPNAEFQNITSRPFWISLIEHKTFAKIDEIGTEAAAATTVLASRGGEDTAVEMIVNRPFFFAILDVETNSILLMGSIVDPRG